MSWNEDALQSDGAAEERDPSPKRGRQRRDGAGRRAPRDRDYRNRADRAQRPRGERTSGRPGQERRAARTPEPSLPDWITGEELTSSMRAELRALSKETAERVAKHLVAALAAVEDDELDAALAHAEFAGRLGARVGVVREVHGTIAYQLGDFRTAVRELRTAVRITGRGDLLPMVADCERGLGRPEKALDVAASPEAARLDENSTIELMIVVAGAYADTGDTDTALSTLDIPALRGKVAGQWPIRLWVAYATLLERAGRPEEARRWLTLAADVDTEGLTDAAERLGRPAPAPKPEPSWVDGEQVTVIDAYDDSEEAR